MSNQKKLESYFSITPEYSELRKAFIYNPEERRAYFDHLPSKTSTFIVSVCGIRLYIEKPDTKSDEILQGLEFPYIHTNASSPLMKSNLQKAIRRKNTHVSIASTLCLLRDNPAELLRRLPIIAIEDVCAMDSYPILVWLMIAVTAKVPACYSLTGEDKYIILQIVNNLSVINDTCGFTKEKDMIEWTHKMIENSSKIRGTFISEEENRINTDICLALMYRSQYGGMKCDMKLINNMILYYNQIDLSVNTIPKTDWYLPLQIPHRVEILREAIDFHPFPNMLKVLYRKTKLKEKEIKEAIWIVESGVNYRKPYTIQISLEHSKTNIWVLLRHHIDDFRNEIIEKDVLEEP